MQQQLSETTQAIKLHQCQIEKQSAEPSLSVEKEVVEEPCVERFVSLLGSREDLSTLNDNSEMQVCEPSETNQNDKSMSIEMQFENIEKTLDASQKSLINDVKISVMNYIQTKVSEAKEYQQQEVKILKVIQQFNFLLVSLFFYTGWFLPKLFKKKLVLDILLFVSLIFCLVCIFFTFF